MNRRNLLAPPSTFKDPRLQKGFQARLWPLSNGNPGPRPGTADLFSRRCLEFLAAYYRLNLRNHALVEAQREKANCRRIKLLLRAVQNEFAVLEKLEDRYAPIGFYGEPVMDGIFYKDIHFVRPELPRILPNMTPESSHVAVPGLEEIPLSELRGPVKVVRLGHGKAPV